MLHPMRRYYCVFFLSICWLFLLAGCSKTPDEQQIRNAIDEIESAVQNRQTGPVLEHLADNFRGPHDMDTRQVRQLMAVHYLRNQNINVVLAGMQVEISGINARVSFNAAVTGGAGMLPERLRYYDIDTQWRKLDGDWLIIRADWAPVGQE